MHRKIAVSRDEIAGARDLRKGRQKFEHILANIIRLARKLVPLRIRNGKTFQAHCRVGW